MHENQQMGHKGVVLVLAISFRRMRKMSDCSVVVAGLKLDYHTRAAFHLHEFSTSYTMSRVLESGFTYDRIKSHKLG